MQGFSTLGGLILLALPATGAASGFDEVWKASSHGIDGGAVVVSPRGVWTSLPLANGPILPLCSVTKLMTAQIAMQLIQEGQLRLDGKVGTCLPWLPAFGRSITVEQLLTHTSGLQNLDLALSGPSPNGFAKIYATRAKPYRSLRGRILRAIGNRPAYAPGTHYDYNNLDFLVLQAVIEKTEGRPFAASLKRRIFRPAGMTTATLAGWGDLPKSVIRSYRIVNGRKILENRFNFGIYGASGGVLASLGDVVRWLKWSLLQPASRSPLEAGSRFGGFQGFGGYAYETDALGEKRPAFERPGAIANYQWQISFLPKSHLAVAAYALNDGVRLGSLFEKKGLAFELLQSAVRP